MNDLPHDEGKALTRLLDHCAQMAGLSDARRRRPRERLEDVVGGDLAARLIGALAGDHRVPARAFVD